jgi:hypothetical protein
MGFNLEFKVLSIVFEGTNRYIEITSISLSDLLPVSTLAFGLSGNFCTLSLQSKHEFHEYRLCGSHMLLKGLDGYHTSLLRIS